MSNTEQLVKQIIDDVKKRGDKGLIEYTKKFDNIKLTKKDFFISRNDCKKSFELVNKNFRSALAQAKKNIEAYHKAQLKNLKPVVIKQKGMFITEKFTPVAKAGVYIPGGRYSYPSSVLMGVIPARIAGVKEIIAVSPRKNLSDEVKAALYVAGVDKILCIGGAQAIAALAYGTESVPKVDVIVGPGNKYVAEAKRQVIGEVGIDMLAGPSEVLVWVDNDANKYIEFLLADLEAQAEHDPDAKAILVSSCSRVISKIKKNIDAKYSKQMIYYHEKTDKKAIEIINKIAPEHLQIMKKDSLKYIPFIENAGAVFVGKFTPVALGDYWLGPSHTLPTNGTAKFSSGLSIHTFIKRRAVMQVDEKYIDANAKNVSILAQSEGMKNHANSVLKRVK